MTPAQLERLRKAHVKRVTQALTKRDKRIGETLDSIHKRFGKGAISVLGQRNLEETSFVSTGFGPLDDIITGDTDDRMRTVAGTGRGLPRGRIVEVYGPESSGKTTLALHVAIAFQRAGHVVAFVDAEHAVDMPYAVRLGISPQDMLFSQPDSGEEAIEIVTTLTRTGAVGLIVVDSVAAMVPMAEQKEDEHKHHVALQARLMSQALRKLAGLASKSGTTILFINQTRGKIGVMFGSRETTSGGNALKFYASVRLDIRKVKTLKTASRFLGIRSRVKAVKNKLASPFREVYVDINKGRGIVEVHGDEVVEKED